jgi:DNA-binding response OmpR family regulator
MGSGNKGSAILVIEDDNDIAKAVGVTLSQAEYEVTRAEDGLRGLQLATKNAFGLVILEVTLPKVGGLEIRRTLRARSVHTPVLFLACSCKLSELKRVFDVEIEGNDCLVKPFTSQELLAKIRALVPRAGGSRPAKLPRELQTIGVGDLYIDADKRQVTRKGRPVRLTAKEFEILLLLARHPGRAYSREQLLNQLWGYDYEGYGLTVNSHINRLRTKIEDDPNTPRFILTVWGVGYKFSET